eukprot:6214550-Pleurochrysis_carterae.AAC.6
MTSTAAARAHEPRRGDGDGEARRLLPIRQEPVTTTAPGGAERPCVRRPGCTDLRSLAAVERGDSDATSVPAAALCQPFLLQR